MTTTAQVYPPGGQGRLERDVRLAKVNEFIETIATTGRRFFSHKGRVGSISIDSKGQMWYTDPYIGRRIYIAHRGRWKGFTEGGTMQHLLRGLREYIRTGEKLNPYSLMRPPGLNQDSWGYGEDMRVVQRKAFELGVWDWPRQERVE